MYNWFLGNIAPENDCFSFLLGVFSGCKILVSGFPGYPNMATNSTFALNPSRLRRWGASFDSVEGRITLGKVWSLRDQTVNGHGEKQNRFNKESKAYPYSLPNTLDDNKEETCLKDQHSRWNVTPFLIDLSLVFQSYRTWGSIGVGLDPPKLTPPEEKAFRGSFHISKPKIAGLLIGKGSSSDLKSRKNPDSNGEYPRTGRLFTLPKTTQMLVNTPNIECVVLLMNYPPWN